MGRVKINIGKEQPPPEAEQTLVSIAMHLERIADALERMSPPEQVGFIDEEDKESPEHDPFM